jgi:glycosyltransferase involved in cell wall biosynthesis
MKILLLCNKAPYPANDGSSIAIYNMALGLISNGVDVHVLTINTKKHFKPDAAVPETFRKQTHYKSVFRNTGTGAFGAIANLFTSDSYFASRFYFADFKQELIALLKANQFDIVQIEGVFMAGYLDVIKMHSKAKIVLRAHNIEHHIWKRHIASTSGLKQWYLKLQNKRLRTFEKGVFPKCDAIVPISDNDTAYLKSTLKALPMYTCITGVDVQKYQLQRSVPQKENTVFSFGSMDWLPNQEAVRWFIKHCWKLVLKEVPDAKLIIAGRAMPLDLFQVNEPNIVIEENVEDAAKFFGQHQILIVPLLSGSGLRIKIIEGMSYGKAIISTSIGAEGIHATPGQDYILADSPEDFAAGVVKLLTDKALKESLQVNASNFARTHFDNRLVVNALVQFYTTLLNDQ